MKVVPSPDPIFTEKRYDKKRVFALDKNGNIIQNDDYKLDENGNLPNKDGSSENNIDAGTGTDE